MERSFITVNGLPAKFISLGDGIEAKPKKIILIIPGNPGLASYYEDFMLSLKPKLPDEYSIWTLGHGGHDIPENAENFPSFSDHAELFNLESTIQQKVDFVKTHISSDQEVILIGHSIGAKMVIEVMKSKIANVKIGCLLFPTVEHMITSPAGISLNRVLKYVPSLFMMSIVWLISCLPRSFLGNVVKLWLQFKLLNFNSSTPYLTDACLGATLDLINPRVVKNVLHLADTELQTVLDLDYDLINELKDDLWFYYGAKDHWVPLEYHENLVKNVPDVDAEICSQNIAHAFVLSASHKMAEIVAQKLCASSIIKIFD